MEKPSLDYQHTVPKRIVDFKLNNQHDIFYLVIWDQHAKFQEWVQDTYLVGCDKLIQDFFTRIEEDEELDLQIEEGSYRGKKKQPNTYRFKWTIDCSRLSKILNNKALQKRIKLKGGKKSQKKYINDDIRLILSKIDALSKYIDSQRPSQRKLDYLLDIVVNVFKKGDTPYITVRTLPPERNLSISLQHMQLYFPQTLKEYYRGLLRLHTRKMMQQNGGQQMDGQDSQESSQEDSADSSSEKYMKMRSFSDDSASKGLYEEMND